MTKRLALCALIAAITTVSCAQTPPDPDTSRVDALRFGLPDPGAFRTDDAGMSSAEMRARLRAACAANPDCAGSQARRPAQAMGVVPDYDEKSAPSRIDLMRAMARKSTTSK